MDKLVIKQSSWHWRYYVFIRALWGLPTTNRQVSLCPYCQTMFWFTVAVIVLSPFLFCGWLILRLERTLYTLAGKAGFNGLLYAFDRTPLGHGFKSLNESVREIPMPTFLGTVIVTVVGTLIMALIVVVGGAAAFGIYQGIIRLPYFVTVILPLFFLVILPAAFTVFINAILVTAHAIWHFLVWIAPVFFEVTGLTLLAVGIGYALLYTSSRIPLCKRVANWLVFRYNGYDQVVEQQDWISWRDRRQMRREARRLARLHRRMNKPPRELRTLSLMVEWVLAIKKRVCPLIEVQE